MRTPYLLLYPVTLFAVSILSTLGCTPKKQATAFDRTYKEKPFSLSQAGSAPLPGEKVEAPATAISPQQAKIAAKNAAVQHKLVASTSHVVIESPPILQNQSKGLFYIIEISFPGKDGSTSYYEVRIHAISGKAQKPVNTEIR